MYTLTSYNSGLIRLTTHRFGTALIAFRQWPRKVVVSDGWNRGSGIRGIQKDLQRSAPARGRGTEALPSSEE